MSSASNRGRPLYDRHILLVQIRFLNRLGRKLRRLGERLSRRAASLSDRAVEEWNPRCPRCGSAEKRPVEPDETWNTCASCGYEFVDEKDVPEHGL